MKHLVLLFILILNGCFGGVPSNKVRKDALTPRYCLYLENKEERNRIDEEWLKSNENFEFGFLPHPYGDEALSGYGITKIKDHKYSKY